VHRMRWLQHGQSALRELQQELFGQDAASSPASKVQNAAHVMWERAVLVTGQLQHAPADAESCSGSCPGCSQQHSV
jgi:hypothetical protein